jgi:1-phosphofructokinase family hexose kinase
LVRPIRPDRGGSLAVDAIQYAASGRGGVSARRARRPGALATIVSLNTALDRTVAIDRLAPGQVHVAREEVVVAGGKGLNVARVAAALGVPVRTLALVGGESGRQVRQLAAAEGLRVDWVRIAGETRTCTILVDRERRATVVNGRGPTVAAAEWQALAARLERRAAAGDAVVLTGSAPPGVPDDVYGRWIARLRALGASALLLDASGALLRHGVAAHPDVVKVNEAEFAAIAAGRGLTETARALVAAGVGLVVVTRGEAGALAFDAAGALAAAAPPVETVNATGSGDAFLAGLLLARHQGADVAGALALATAAASLNAAQLAPGVPGPEAVLALAGEVRVEPWSEGPDTTALRSQTP